MNPDETEKKPEIPHTSSPVKSLRTYQGDVQEAISKNNFSSSDIFLAEQRRKGEAPEKSRIDVFNKPEIKNKFLAILSVILLVLGIGVMGFVFFLRSNDAVITDQRTRSIIGFSQEVIVSVSTTTREKLVNQLLQEKSFFKQPVNSVLYINTVGSSNEPERTERVLTYLAPKMPSSLARSFSEKYMIGVFSFDTNEPFILLKTEDYALSFAGMLRWEKDMVSDIGKLFGVVVNASSTPASFVDQERRNKDMRVLKDTEGKILFLYSFIDNETLLITKNENIFTAVLSKYLINQQDK